MKVLIVVLPDEHKQCGLNFAITILQFQMAVLKRAAQELHVRFGESKDGALDTFYEDPSFDRLIVVDAFLSFDPDLLLRMVDSGHDFTVGTYPAGDIDWAKVKTGSTERLQFTGNSYNLGPHVGTEQDDWLPVEHAELGLFCITRAVVDKVVPRVHAHSAGHVWTNKGIMGPKGRLVSQDESFCRVWEGPIHADLRHPVSRFGSMDFIGSVGQRRALR